jgi:hypothetical protein
LNRAMCTAHWMSSGVTDSSSMRTCNTQAAQRKQATVIDGTIDGDCQKQQLAHLTLRREAGAAHIAFTARRALLKHDRPPPQKVNVCTAMQQHT